MSYRMLTLSLYHWPPVHFDVKDPEQVKAILANVDRSIMASQFTPLKTNMTMEKNMFKRRYIFKQLFFPWSCSFSGVDVFIYSIVFLNTP